MTNPAGNNNPYNQDNETSWLDWRQLETNAAPNDVTFGIHEGAPPEWKRVVDTGRPSPQDILEPGQEEPVEAHEYEVKERSIVVLVRKNNSPAKYT